MIQRIALIVTFLTLISLAPQPVHAAEETENTFLDRIHVEGFGEINRRFLLDPDDFQSGDPELFSSHFYGVSGIMAFEITPNVELELEMYTASIHNHEEEAHFEYFPEGFLHLDLHEALQIKVGSTPKVLGYLNEDDHPLMYNTVSRPMTEKIILPSGWVVPGVRAFGEINDNFSYSASIYTGHDATAFEAPSWIRGGIDPVFDVGGGYGFTPSLAFHPNDWLEIVSSFYVGRSNEELTVDEESTSPSTRMSASYLKLSGYNLEFLGSFSYGWQNETPEIASYHDYGPEGILGEEVFGGYAELKYDLWSFWGDNVAEGSEYDSWLFKRGEMGFPVFGRVERLNTHHSVHEDLKEESYLTNDLWAYAFGKQYKPRSNVAFKVSGRIFQQEAEEAGGGIPHFEDLTTVETGVAFTY